MNTILAIVIYNLKSMLRNFKSTGIMFILPIVFMGVFAIAFGGSESDRFSFIVGVVSPEDFTVDFQEVFENISNESEDIEIITQSITDKKELISQVESESLDSGLYLSIDQEIQQVSYEIILQSATSQRAQLIRGIVQSGINEVLFEGNYPVATQYIDNQEEVTDAFDLLAPGLIVYGLIILIPGIANTFAEIIERKYIFRYSISKISALEIITGNVIYYMIIGVIQTVLLYFTAIFFGYNSVGNLLIAIIPAILSLFFVIAMGILIGGLVNKAEAATNIGTIVSIIFGFFSGSFIVGIGNVLEFDLFGYTMQFNDLLPTKWATVALESVLTENMGLDSITNELLILLISGLATLAISIYVFSSKQLKSKD